MTTFKSSLGVHTGGWIGWLERNSFFPVSFEKIFISGKFYVWQYLQILGIKFHEF